MEGLGLTFGERRPPFDLRVIEKQIGRIAPIRRKSLVIPGRPGAVSNGYDTDIRLIKVVLDFEAESKIEWLEKLEVLAAWFIREDPEPLIFEQEPGRMYMAEMDGEIETKEIGIYGQVTINFICNDPYVYKGQFATSFVEGVAIVRNNGKVETPPIYEIEVLDSITHLDIFTDKNYLRFGEPAPIENVVYQRQTLILNDTMKSLNNWTTPTEIDNGYIGGTIVATQAGFEATSFGAAIQPLKWQGPAKQRSLPETVQNFRADIPIELLNVTKETGMIEIYFLDALGNTIAKIGMEDVWPTLKKNQGKFQLGNVDKRKIEYHRQADYAPAWNDFKGMLRVHRDGNLFRPYFAQIQPDGKHVWVSQQWSYRDEALQYMAPIAQVKVAIRKWPGTSTSQANMRIKGIKFWRYNDPAEGIPYIANQGDKFVIDTGTGIVTLNGEERDDMKDFFSDFFDIEPGMNTLLLQPFDKLSGKVIIRERSR
ncbi:hypothetical protein B481_1991 [Planococcus halocryophilus Or1]|uniref:Phage tail protein n=1 Tax=Planococcus halocryophilus TaxID=1215089 RepID=A0A1C7DPC5_9BACL|nr:distal tail protein Dit [Planococcus halocryophilus]ANU13460.1 hypothetical protein BBI08_06220 [Planococcus halocryophilus]EMF46264.1 hypothetical protein B481_1991 [Planococcus halocryophilus Or1]